MRRNECKCEFHDLFKQITMLYKILWHRWHSVYSNYNIVEVSQNCCCCCRFLYFGIQVVLLRQHFSISASFYVRICVFSDFEDSLCSCSAVFKSQELLLISQQLSKVPGWFGLSFLCGQDCLAGLSFQSPFKSWSFYSWWHGLLDLSSTNPWS